MALETQSQSKTRLGKSPAPFEQGIPVFSILFNVTFVCPQTAKLADQRMEKRESEELFVSSDNCFGYFFFFSSAVVCVCVIIVIIYS